MANICYNSKSSCVYANDGYQWIAGTNGTEIGSARPNAAKANAIVATRVGVCLAAW